MSEQTLYRALVAWLRARHPQVLAEWERERQQPQRPRLTDSQRLQALPGRTDSVLDEITPGAGFSEVTQALKRDLELLGISGGTAGVTQDGTPCIHLIKQGVYGRAYEEDVTLARLRDPGYRRYLKQVFG